jgi:hypothetical protein
LAGRPETHNPEGNPTESDGETGTTRTEIFDENKIQGKINKKSSSKNFHTPLGLSDAAEYLKINRKKDIKNKKK